MGVYRPRNSYRVDTPPDDRHGVHYSFYKPNGYTQSKIVTDKLRGAEKIFVWDPSFNLKDRVFYDHITTDKIYLEILTICDKYQGEKEINEYFTLIKDDLLDRGFNVEIDFTLYAFFFDENKDNNSLELWHDRFLILERKDEKEVYLVGTSVASQLNGHKAFGICELTEDLDKNIVMKAYEEYRDLLVDNENGIKLHIKDPE